MKIFVKITLSIIFAFYLMILTQQILFKYIPLNGIINHFQFSNNEYHWRSSNLIPFKTIIFYLFLADINLNIRIENLVGNIIGFMPLGFLSPLLSKKLRKLVLVTGASFLLSLTYELLQLFFEFGSFDVDDLILNTLGGALGYLPFKLIHFFINFKKQIQSRNANVSK